MTTMFLLEKIIINWVNYLYPFIQKEKLILFEGIKHKMLKYTQILFFIASEN